MARVLYLSTDGLTDPLGRSQILPYLESLAARNHSIHIISLEKHQRAREVTELKKSIHNKNLNWLPLGYHQRPSVLSTLFDLWSMRRAALRTAKKGQFQIIHTRSYLAGLVGLSLRKRLKAKLLFDARGFWIDERLEGGIWPAHNPIYRFVALWLRKIEQRLYTTADAVVMLTNKARLYLANSNRLKPSTPLVEVIPCCADESFFSYASVDRQAQNALRRKLGLTRSDLVVMYHGSLGTWYLADELLNFQSVLLEKFPEAKLVVITGDDVDRLKRKWEAGGHNKHALVTCAATRSEIPALLTLASVSVFFIKPVFSKIASSPTKMAEIICMDIPLVTNTGIGDGDDLLAPDSGAYLIREFSTEAYREVINKLTFGEQEFRYSQKLKDYFSLKRGVEKYHNLYDKLSS